MKVDTESLMWKRITWALALNVFLYLPACNTHPDPCERAFWLKLPTFTYYAYRIMNEKMTCEDAQRHCIKHGGHGLTIANWSTQSYITRFVLPERTNVNGNDQFLIGLRNLDLKGLRWDINGKKLKKNDYMNFLTDYGTQTKPGCVAIDRAKGDKWIIQPHSVKMFHICESLVPCSSFPAITDRNGSILTNDSKLVIESGTATQIKCILKGSNVLIWNFRMVCMDMFGNESISRSIIHSSTIVVTFQPHVSMHGKVCECRSKLTVSKLEVWKITMEYSNKVAGPELVDESDNPVVLVQNGNSGTATFYIYANPPPQDIVLVINGMDASKEDYHVMKKKLTENGITYAVNVTIEEQLLNTTTLKVPTVEISNGFGKKLIVHLDSKVSPTLIDRSANSVVLVHEGSSWALGFFILAKPKPNGVVLSVHGVNSSTDDYHVTTTKLTGTSLTYSVTIVMKGVFVITIWDKFPTIEISNGVGEKLVIPLSSKVGLQGKNSGEKQAVSTWIPPVFTSISLLFTSFIVSAK